jgi:hypothetical protein
MTNKYDIHEKKRIRELHQREKEFHNLTFWSQYKKKHIKKNT